MKKVTVVCMLIVILCLPVFLSCGGGSSSSEPEGITVSWIAPTQNEDGSKLTDLAGYIVYYGRKSGEPYEHWESVGMETHYTFDNLDDGETYYITVTAYDTSGNESEYAKELIK